MRYKQQGASMYVTLIWIIIGISVATLGVKIGPIYLDNYTIASALGNLKQDENLWKLSNKEIVKRLYRQLQINNIRNFDAKNITIVRDKTKLSVNVDYEVRTNIVRNIDAVVSFENHLEVSKAGNK